MSTEVEKYPQGEEVTFFQPNSDAIKALESSEEGKDLSVKYMEVGDWKAECPDPKKPMTCFFMGLEMNTNAQGKSYAIAKLHNGKRGFVCGQMVLTQALSQTKVGQGVNIYFLGTKENAHGGRTGLFEVKEKNINIFGDGNDD